MLLYFTLPTLARECLSRAGLRRNQRNGRLDFRTHITSDDCFNVAFFPRFVFGWIWFSHVELLNPSLLVRYMRELEPHRHMRLICMVSSRTTVNIP